MHHYRDIRERDNLCGFFHVHVRFFEVFMKSLSGKIECMLTYSSVFIVVTALQLLNNEIYVTSPPEVNCTDLCNLKSSSNHFGYGIDDGPNIWPSKFRECGGRRQSPIDLDTTSSVTRYHPHLYWWNYNRKPKRMTLWNNGHTAMIEGKWENEEEIPCFWPSTGNHSAKEGNYVFRQLHFHWGSNHTTGSEHMINSMRYPLEMHIVHTIRKHEALQDALSAGEDNVFVIAVLFQVSKHINDALTPIISSLRNVILPDTRTDLNPFEIRRLLPEFSNFLMYNGSITSPPCTEGVSWVVKLEASLISIDQLNEFHLLRNDKNEPLSDNYRPVQPLNNRNVWHIK